MSKGIAKKWLFNETPEEEFNKPYVLGWIDEEIYHRNKPKKKLGFVPAIDRMKPPESIADILSGIL